MKKLTSVFVTATLLLNAMVPTLAHAATYLQGSEVNANTLIQDAYVQVTYLDNKKEQRVTKGWIDAIGETTFTIRSGGVKSKTGIAYDKVVSVVMSDESTVPAKQMNEVNRFVREMRKREIKKMIETEKREAKETAIQRLKMIETEKREAKETAIQRLKDKIATSEQFDLSKNDSSAIEPGTFVEVTYGKGDRDPVSGEWKELDTVRGYIQAIYADRLVIGERFWKKEVALDSVQKLTIADSFEKKRKTSLEIGAELLAIQFATSSSETFTTIINLGSGIGLRTSPSIYVSSFFFNRLALNLGLGVTAISVDERSWALWLGRGGFTYLPQGTTSNSVYIRSFALILGESSSYSSDFSFGAGIGVGYRAVVQDRMAIRLETSYMRWFEEKENHIALRLSVGVVLGGKSPSPKSE